MTTTVRIIFDATLNSNNITMWGNRCEWVRDRCVDKVDTAFTLYHADLIFENDKDAFLFLLRWGGLVIEQSHLTVEYVGNLIN